MKSLWDALPAVAPRRLRRDRRRAGAAGRRGPVEPGDMVMVKGSNGSKASLIAAALAALDADRRGAA